ncbi:hypothetical protein C7S16_7182 [Burkholderia thailandensis]|uniref:Uncharacterized protein n=1 Tax=Burkholderia thailandensis TaxID=57975 RepID=A0AAW9CQ12_BURTH|nr:hypothetical protein [Burkholderia thailandensis]
MSIRRDSRRAARRRVERTVYAVDAMRAKPSARAIDISRQ